jgi:exodeoxyribonuclease VIII
MGAVRDISLQEYLRLVGVNWSSVAKMNTSALRYHDELLDPPEPTAPMILGSAIHTAVLEPQKFEAQWALFDGRRGTNAYKDWQAEHPDQTALSASEWDQCMGAAYAVHRLPQGRDARRVMRNARRELSLIWTDPATGIRCKCRPDLLRMTREQDRTLGVWELSDVKTTASVDARKFGRLSAEMLYHGKMAFAVRGIEAIFGRLPVRVSIIGVEQKRPHDVAVFPLDPDVLYAGDQLVTKLLRQLKTCRRRRTWPGRYDQPVTLDFPEYALAPASDYSDAIEVLS